MMIEIMPGNNTRPKDDDDDGGDASEQAPARHPIHPAKPSMAGVRPNLAPFRGRRRRASCDRNNFRSSLRTVESSGAGSLDIYDDESNASSHDLMESQLSRESSGASVHKTRRHSFDMGGSSNHSLMVSFSRLNEHELTHLRKWNRRLHRTEVFDKYYFPAKWEASEMEAIIGFLKLEDPSAKLSLGGGGGVRGGSLRGSGKMKSSPTEIGGVRGRLTGNRSLMSGSWQSGDKGATTGGSLSSSLTSSLKDSAGKLTKLLADTKQQAADPAKVTKHALDFLFYPYVHDPKSVLLKRGSVFIRDAALHNERELMIFTHGFLLANVVLEDAFSLYLALSDREFLTEKSFMDYLRNKFREMDDEESGEIDKWELQKLFMDMGIPMAESILEELIQRIDSTKRVANGNGDCGKVNWEALHKALQEYFFQKNVSAFPSLNNVRSVGLDDSGSEREPGTGGLKNKLLGAFQKKKVTTVECAALFSNVVRVDCLNICHGEDSVSRDIANSEYAELSFSVTLKDRENHPLIFVCSKPEYRDSWVEAFKPGVVRALAKSSNQRMKDLQNKIGWQHLVIRSSFISLVILNDSKALRRACQGEEGTSYRKLRLELNLLDEYSGYSPLHYATVLGHAECMEVLLEAGSKVTVEDRDGRSPMYHALSQRNDEVANILERFGADRNDDLQKLISHELQEEELKKLSSTNANGRLATHVESNALDLSSSGRDENIDDLLMKAVGQFASAK